MFESHFVCHFFRLWGYEEGKKKQPMNAALLGNMQNDFDNKFGDVCAQVGARFFFIEFKRERSGFKDEVSLNAKGKPHRAAFYEHLLDEKLCRLLSCVGHFGAYADKSNQLVFEPYAHCMADIKSRQSIDSERFAESPAEFHELNYQSWVSDFGKFYSNVTVSDPTLREAHPEFFETGLGLNIDQLATYISCMYDHLQEAETDSGETLLCVMHPITGMMIPFFDNLPSLVMRLHSVFADMQSMIALAPKLDQEDQQQDSPKRGGSSPLNRKSRKIM